MNTTPRIMLDQAISYHKEIGRDYDDLDLDTQQKLCVLCAKTWKINEQADVADRIDALQLLAYMERGDAQACGEYMFTLMQNFIEPFLREEFNN